jgi:hypothetical protein
MHVDCCGDYKVSGTINILCCTLTCAHVSNPASGKSDIHNAPCLEGHIAEHEGWQGIHDLFFFSQPYRHGDPCREKFLIKREALCFHRQVFNHSLSILLLPERGCGLSKQEKCRGFLADITRKEEYFHG